MGRVLTRILLILGLAGATFAAGWFSKGSRIVIQTKIEEVEKIVEKTVVVREQKPDGTVTETTTKDTTTDSNKQRPDPIVFQKTRNDWGLGVSFNPADFYSDKPIYYPTTIAVERRVLGNLWGGVGYNIRHKEVQLGLRWEF